MIKRLSFIDRAPDVAADTFGQAWTQAWADQGAAPPTVRPARVVVCTTLPDLDGPEAPHDGVAVEWFTDAGHLADHDAWSRSASGAATSDPISRLVVDRIVVDEGTVVVADEVVLRGADWLARRWVDGGPRFKHMALAQRAAGTSAAEFSDRWHHHAGQVGRSSADGGSAPTLIPDDVRGQAYVQNHPRPRPHGDWA